MFFYFAQLFGAAAVYEGARRTIIRKFSEDVNQYGSLNAQVSMEMLLTHLAHASTLRTKAQFCTWFMTFVSQAYKGEACAAALRLITELADMEDVTETGKAEVQAGEDRDIAAECRAFMVQYPQGLIRLDAGTDMDVQASWEGFRQHYSFGVDSFKALRYSPFYRHLRKIIAACLAGSFLSEKLFSEHPWFHKRLFEGVDHKGNLDPMDLFDEVLDLSKLVFDAATLCAQTGSLKPLLGRGKEAYDLDTEHAWLAAHQEYYEIGSLEAVTETAKQVVTDEMYVVRVERHLQNVKRYHSGSRDAERLVMQRRLTDVMKWNAAIQLRLTRASLRIEPFSIFLFGPTAQGKTATGMSMVKLLLQANGFPFTQDVVAQVDSASKYMDTVQNSTMGVIMDDVANTKPTFQTYDALAQFIQLNNTSVVPVSKAGVDEKGKVTHNSKVVLVSSNVKDLNAKETSQEPSAILRRFKIALRVTIAPEFARQYDPSTVDIHPKMRSLNMIDPSKLTEGIYSDHQRFEVLEWVPKERTQVQTLDEGDWFTVKVDGRLLRDLRMDETMRYMCARAKSHFTNQRRMVDAFKADELLPICKHGGVTAPFCSLCKAEALELQAGDGITEFFFPSSSTLDEFSVREPGQTPSEESVSVSTVDSAPLLDTPLTFRERLRVRREAAQQTARALWERATVAEEVPAAPPVVGWLKAWSHGVLDIERLAFTHFDAVMLGVLSVAPVAAVLCSSFLSLLGAGWFMTSSTFLFTFGYTGITLSRNVRGWVSARVAGATLQELRKRALDMARASFGVLATIIGVLSLIQGLRKLAAVVTAPAKSQEHRATAQAKDSDVLAMDLQGGQLQRPAPPDPVPKTNMWERRDVEVFHHTDGPTRNMTADQIYAKLGAQIYVMTITYKSGNIIASNCFIPATNYLLAPAHNFLTPDGQWAEIAAISVQRTTESRGPVFRVKTAPSQMHRLPGDCMLVQINAGGTMPDVLDLIADEAPQVGFSGVELYRNTLTCGIEQQGYLVTPEPITCVTYGMRYWGLSYIRAQPTFKGLCGALVLTAARYPKVTGFHTMGVTGGNRGVSCCFTRGDIVDGIAALRQKALLCCPVVVQNDTTPFTPTGMEEAGVMAPLSKNSVVREMEPGTELKAMGTLLNHRQVRPSSDLVVSPLSAIVEEECGEARAHEAPRNIGKATVEVAKLREMAGRATINPQDMELAKRDMYEELCALVVSLNFAAYFVVHTIAEACSGLAGSSTMRSINRGTAAGWPFLGNKHPFLVDEPRPGLPDAFTLTPETEADLMRVMERMENLERVNLMFKGSHKSEPVKIGKEKTRVFEGSPLLLTILFRMFFMPIIRLYLLARAFTGSAVGIDATSSEWDNMFSFFTEFNPTEAIIGDWRHFDTSQAYQEMMAVFCIWIAVMEKYGNYTQAQLNVMWVIAEEVCRHYALFRGDVVQTEGTNPSGGAGTVYINNPVGGLRFAAAFYGMVREQGTVSCGTPVVHEPGSLTNGGLRVVVNGRAGMKPLLPNLDGRFLDYVRSMLYGDDFVHAPKPIIVPWYNQKTLYTYFAKEGMYLTDANKQPFESATTPWDEVTFLKRGFRRDADTGHVMAPLEMGSIYKSLHVWPKKLTWAPEVHAAQIFCGSIRELFQHGREVYEQRVPGLLRAAQRFGSLPYMATQVTSYDEMRAEWMARELKSVATFEEHTAPSE